VSLTIGSLFSGIGGLELGLEWASLGPVVWQCEIDPFCRAVLAKHWPGVTRYEDVTAVRRWPLVDLVCGGFPCQDVSSAGKRRGLGGERSGLWWYFARVVRDVGPAFVVVENVSSGSQAWLPAVRRQLRGLGYRTRALGIAASDCGAPHRRARTFVVAHALGKRGRRQPVATAGQRDGAEFRPAAGRAWRDTEPPVGGMADGLPRGLDNRRRIRALGNAVVPQCAQVVGEVIQQMLAAEGT
jgi:DNA (cytosine-5)-methyltransferase 1